MGSPRVLFAGTLALVLAAGVDEAAAAVYHVGPGQPLATPSDVPWESLAGGDSVYIHGRATAYHDKWVICRAGTSVAPIVVRGVPDGSGALPVIDGANAVTRSALNFWNEERGVIKIGGANTPPDAMPAYVSIEQLDIRGAHTPNTFTGRVGLTSYATNAAAIYIEKGQHVTIRGCHLSGCGNGLFCASETSDLLVEGNWIEGNGNVGSIYEHNNYTEALGITFQYNRFGPLLAGAGGNNLKDRSAGTVIRYNWIEGGNRQLDLVDSDFPTEYNDPRYHQTFVYGNVLLEPGDDGNSQIAHYGGDSGNTATYRQGMLYFQFNTVVSRRTGNTTLLRLSSDGESADVRDNLVFVTATGSHLALLDQTGTLDATRNWMKSGWAASFSGGTINDHGQITGTSPGFGNQAGNDFTLVAGSACLDTAAALSAACVPNYVPVREYVKDQASRARANDGRADLGAFERSAVTGVPVGSAGRPRLVAAPNPSRTFEITLRGGAAGAVPLEIVDVRGRVVARIAPVAQGRWTWTPAHSLGGGVYFARLGALTVRMSLVR
jgi:hypothetical protein